MKSPNSIGKARTLAGKWEESKGVSWSPFAMILSVLNRREGWKMCYSNAFQKLIQDAQQKDLDAT
jgi:hypothetical protein